MDNNIMMRNLSITTGKGVYGSPAVTGGARTTAQTPQTSSFKTMLGEELSRKELTFSKHAMERLSQRNMDLSASDVERLNEALDKALGKGLGDTLILMDDNAFIANARNRTIITAMTGSDVRDNVFTNIDGALII